MAYRPLPPGKFGRLTVLGLAEKDDRGRSLFECVCDCGKNVFVVKGNLVSGNTKSCGCLQRDQMATQFLKHGATTNREGKFGYWSWTAMIQRCTNPKHLHFSNYGGRGITVCERWLNSFENFLADMGPRPDGLTIERRNNYLGYFKSNCRWATRKEQMANLRSQTKNQKQDDEKKT